MFFAIQAFIFSEDLLCIRLHISPHHIPSKHRKCWLIGSLGKRVFYARTVSVYTTTYRTQRRGLHESGPWSTRSNALDLVPHFLLVAHVKFVSWVIILLFLSWLIQLINTICFSHPPSQLTSCLTCWLLALIFAYRLPIQMTAMSRLSAKFNSSLLAKIENYCLYFFI